MVPKATGSQSKTNAKTAKGGGKEPKGSNPKSDVLKKIFTQPHSSNVVGISFIFYCVNKFCLLNKVKIYPLGDGRGTRKRSNRQWQFIQ